MRKKIEELDNTIMKAQKELESALAIGARDPRHESTPEFKGTKGKGWGKASFPTDLTDESASMLTAIHPELDAMSDRFKIPRLRGYRAVTGAQTMGNMGDASMGVNPTYFNAFAAKVGGKSSNDLIDKLAGDRDALRLKLEAQRVEIDKAKEKLRNIGFDHPDFIPLHDEYKRLALIYNRDIKTFNGLAKKAAATQRKGADTVATWKVGDDVQSRPFNAADYFTGIDRARNVLYHEFAHHLHQTYQKTERRSYRYRPPLEVELRDIWQRKFYGNRPDAMGAKNAQASKYATTNEHEWFAENFSLYMMGRKDLVDGDALTLIERLLDETN